MRQYEFVVVIQPTLEDEGVTAIVNQVEEIIRRGGGEILGRGQLLDKKGTISEAADTWSKRRLAYPINGHREGYYAVLRYSGPSPVIGEIEQLARLNEAVLRYLTIRCDE